jgi:medium-chain acyl-[acyl-carrier-protein] hydrolase
MPAAPQLVDLGPPGADRHVLALPHAGAGVAALYPVATALAPRGVALHVVRLPGRETRIDEPPIDDAGTLVDLLAPAAAKLGPVVVFGHSTGALTAFLLARRLCVDGHPPLRLVVSGRRAPHLPAREAPIHALPGPAFRTGIERLAGEPVPELHNEALWEFVEPALRADIGLDERYRFVPAPRLPCPILVLRAGDSASVTPGELAAWAEHTTAGLRVADLPGTHFYLQTEPGDLARVLVD